MEQVLYFFFNAFDFLVSIIGYLLLAVSVIGLLIAAKHYSLKRISYRRYFGADGVFEDGEVELIEEISNRSFLPLIHVDIESRVTQYIHLLGYDAADEDGAQHFISRFTIMPFTTIRRTHKAVCTRRGFYELQTAQTYFMLKEYVLDSPAVLYVYPKPLSLMRKHRLDTYMQSMEPTQIPVLSDPFSFAGIREYTPKDSFHMINFKATARHGGQLYVNQTDFVTGNRQMLYLNFEPDSGHSTEEFRQLMETALSCCTYLLERAFSNGYEIGFCANCQMIDGKNFLYYPMSRGMYHYEELLKEFSCIRMVRGRSMASLLTQDAVSDMTGTELYIMTLTCDERMEKAMARLEAQGNQVQLIRLDEI